MCFCFIHKVVLLAVTLTSSLVLAYLYGLMSSKVMLLSSISINLNGLVLDLALMKYFSPKYSTLSYFLNPDIFPVLSFLKFTPFLDFDQYLVCWYSPFGTCFFLKYHKFQLNILPWLAITQASITCDFGKPRNCLFSLVTNPKVSIASGYCLSNCFLILFICVACFNVPFLLPLSLASKSFNLLSCNF